MYEQMSIFDLSEKTDRSIPETEEPKVGEYVSGHGANICHVMRPSYIGKKVIYDCSTKRHEWFRCGILEKYIPYEGHMRSIIYTGERQRVLLTHYPGIEIYECLPWDAYPKRMKAIYGDRYHGEEEN